MYHTSLPPANEVWCKVMFSEARDSHSVHGRQAWQGRYAWQGDMRGGDMCGRGVCGKGGCVAGGHAWQGGEGASVQERRSLK